MSRAQPTFFYTGHGQVPVGVKLTQSQTPPPRIPKTQQPVSRVPGLPPLGHHNHRPAAQSPSPGPAPEARPPVDALPEDVTDAAMSPAAAAVKRRLFAGVAPSEHHSPAQFMAEITAFVQEQLHLLNKKYPPHLQQADDEGRDDDPTATRLQQEQYRVVGGASLSVSEKARKARLHIFTQAQRIFAESFRSYKLFLDALADEHVAYDRYLEDRVIRSKEIVAGLEAELQRRDARHQDEVTTLKAEHARQLAAVTADRDKLARQRQQLLESQRDRHKENDSKKQIQDLEHQLRTAEETLAKLQEDCESLARQNEVLSIGTFSDALDQANQQLAELKTMNAKKDDLLIESHDETAALTRDLKKIVHFFNSRSEHPLTPSDVRVSDVTLRALFPEEARKLATY